MYCNELNKAILKHAEVNNLQAMKLLEMKNQIFEFEIKLRIYPATEIRKKIKVLVNVFFPDI